MFKIFSSDENREITFEDVKKIEREIIKKQRQNRNNDGGEISTKGKPKLGLALSGGGIRSASFALGVIQALHRCCLFREVDYLSTVSGGGYTGSAITWFNYRKQKLFESKNTKSPANKPAMLGAADTGARSIEKQRPDKESHDFLDYVRQHGDYLTPCKKLSTLSLAGEILSNSLIAIIVYFSLLVAAMFILVKSGFFASTTPWLSGFFSEHSLFLDAAILLLGFSVIIAVIVSFRSRSPSEDSSRGYLRRINIQKVYGLLMMASLILVALSTLEPLRSFLANLLNDTKSSIPPDESLLKQISGLVTLLAGAAGAFHEFAAMRAGKSKVGGIRIWIIASLLIYGLFYASYLTAYHLSNPPGLQLGWPWLAAFLGTGLIVGWFTNLNMFGINRMYRDRLMEAFMPDPDKVKKNKWAPSCDADQAKVLDMCGDNVFPHSWETIDDIQKDKISTPGPYHLVNTNVVLSDSDEAKFRGRGGDNFIISPAFSGGDSIHWCKTTDFVNGRMSQATAMAISGAALNPSAGVGGRGVTRNRLISFMMGFFHIRLGWWLPNPRIKKFFRAPNFIWPGLTQGVFSNHIKEDSRFIELTDGGHFENTGMYELIRRRLPLIILSQAGADPDFTLGDISNAIERVKVDFGVTIEFLDGYGLDEIIPNGGEGNEPVEKRFSLSRKGFSIARILYPKKKKPGHLIIVKTLMTKDLPMNLFHYKAVNQAFPNQTTSDQFFDENQFEAYRELGYQLTKQMACEIYDHIGGKKWAKDCLSIKNLEDWLNHISHPFSSSGAGHDQPAKQTVQRK